jgi:hypothetical protein
MTNERVKFGEGIKNPFLKGIKKGEMKGEINSMSTALQIYENSFKDARY